MRQAMTRNAIRKMDESTQTMETIEALKKDKNVWYVEHREKDGFRESQEKHKIFYVVMWNEEIVKIYVK
jgi:hypothetical protein